MHLTPLLTEPRRSSQLTTSAWTFPDDTSLATECSSLLDSLLTLPKYQQAYRLEIEPGKITYSVTLLMDPLGWYDEVLKDVPLAEKVQLARSYVSKLRLSASQSVPHIPSSQPINTDEYCVYPHTCPFGTRCRRHAKNYCTAEKLPRRNSIPHDCNWFCRDELVLPFSLPDYVVTARPDPIRDILVAPKKHQTNSELARTAEFWKVISALLKDLSARSGVLVPFNKIALNFGIWETRQGSDINALDCHGHLHIHLPLHVVQASQSLPGFDGIQGREQDPPDYKEEDAKMLEQKRLIGDEAEVTSSRISMLETTVNTVADQVSQILALLKPVSS